MRQISLTVLIFTAGFFSCCSYVRNEQIVGKYHILAVDVYDDACLAYEVKSDNYVCLVPSKIVAYCKNERYLFLKQIPYPDKNILNVNYYIVPILKDNPAIYPEGRIVGPLKEQQFNKEISKMNLRNLKFKQVD